MLRRRPSSASGMRTVAAWCRTTTLPSWFRRAAEQGYAPGQAALGFMYARGRGVVRDDAEAVRWHRRAAEQDNARAQNNLGVSYRNGLGVVQDYGEAVRWFRRAAEQGHAGGRTTARTCRWCSIVRRTTAGGHPFWRQKPLRERRAPDSQVPRSSVPAVRSGSHVRVHRQGFAQNRGRGRGTFPAVQDGVRRWRTSRS